MSKYLVGDPTNGPFVALTVTDEDAARAEAEKYGRIADEVDWDWNGEDAVMFVVVDAEDPNGLWPSKYPDRDQ